MPPVSPASAPLPADFIANLNRAAAALNPPVSDTLDVYDDGLCTARDYADDRADRAYYRALVL